MLLTSPSAPSAIFGYKINSAEDNPAGMAISNKMKAQIEALDQAKSNSSDAQKAHIYLMPHCLRN